MHRVRDLSVQAWRLEADYLLIADGGHGRFWSFYAAFYDAIWDSPVVDRISAAVGTALEPMSSVLDMGCGTGLVARHLRSMGTRVIAVDASSSMIDLCRRREAADVYLVGAQPPVEYHWDSAVLANVLHVCEDASALLASVVRRTPGRIVVIWPLDMVGLTDLARWERSGQFRRLATLRSAALRVLVGVPGSILGVRRHSADYVRRVVLDAAAASGRGLHISEIPETGCSIAVIEART